MGTSAIRQVEDGGEADPSQAVRDLLATVLHEARTPLSCLAATVEVLLGNFEDLEAHDARAMLARMQRSATWLQALVDNLTIAAQLETCQLHLAPTPVSLAECVETALALVHPLLDRNGQSVEVEGDLGLQVHADGRRVEQVLVNLLMNASKYGGITEPIRLVVEGGAETVRIWVKDQGPGIARDEQGQIFERYARGNAAVQSGVSGLGLGLHIVKTLVERQGGRVGVESEVGAGAAFWVELPTARPSVFPRDAQRAKQIAPRADRVAKRRPTDSVSQLVAIAR